MKITAHMKDGPDLIWENLAEILVLTTQWARLVIRGESWDMSLPYQERHLGSVILLNMTDMVWWEQENDDLDEANQTVKSWLDAERPPEGTA